MRTSQLLAVALALVAGTQSGTAQYWFIDTFDTSASLAYYHVDRYAPSVFTNAFFDGSDRLQLTVNGSAPTSGTGSIQGMKRLTDTGALWGNGLTTGYSLDFYVDPAWADDSKAQLVSFWSQLKVNPADVGSDYYWPNLSYWSKTDNTATFLVYPTNTVALGDFAEVSLPLGFTAGWHTITYLMESDGNYWYVDGSLLYKDTYYYADIYKPTAVETVIIQGRNYGTNYNIYADNVQTIPEPSALILVAGGAGALLFVYRRRRRSGTTR